MLWKTHLAFGLFVALVAMPFVTTGNKIVFVVLAMVASLLPDIDEPNSKISNQIPVLPKILSLFVKHRGIFHTLFLALLIPGVVWYFVGHSYGVAIFVGYMSHLLIDGMTLSGINFLHPVSKLHVSGFIKTGGAGEWVVFFLIIVGIMFKLL